MQARGRAAQTLWQAYVQQRSSSLGLSLPSSRSLWDIVNRTRLEPHNADAIRDIWMEFHADPLKHRIASVMPAARYVKFAENASKSPMFVLPVFKGPNAFENFVAQCQLPIVLFTSLEDYKQHGSGAQPQFVLTHYTELSSAKDVVLVRGDIVSPNAVSRLEAETLTRLLHDFYTIDQKYYGFVHPFNHRQADFDLKKMLDSLGHDTTQLPQV
ncbi:assembly factor 1 for F1 component of mitochondrial ATP synthase [Chlorella sorokiniana]|uniref:Assembly factor 1 for F1 component of mitochondrial ATP synthase n=1 Tax=Chlorella sorokiniana TaxID=3076 RepID=A0A2P6TMD8_CHLSO|nr:assembly factor 1 for F1 component of mitochondrial ATP synthase [Chlorella sorokiniana]|eukprot:PRW45501.1 assembly factor 1 for F1 component of mitochondrial ATP synthase [Chlorella sorokiniana]